MLDIPPHYASVQEEEDIEEETEDTVEEVEEIVSHDPNEQTQEVFSRSQQHTVKFGDNDNLIKASIVDVDCSS